MRLRALHLFAGAGGSVQACRKLGMESVGCVEIDRYCCAVLEKHGEKILANDITTWHADGLAGRVDIVVGGSPCQDVSTAGKRAGFNGTKSVLWRDQIRVAKECQAPLIWWENVRGALSSNGGRDFGVVLSDLAEAGYDARWTLNRASDVGAPHRRERIWLFAWKRNMAHAPFFWAGRDSGEFQREEQRHCDEQGQGGQRDASERGSPERMANAGVELDERRGVAGRVHGASCQVEGTEGLQQQHASVRRGEDGEQLAHADQQYVHGSWNAGSCGRDEHSDCGSGKPEEFDDADVRRRQQRHAVQRQVPFADQGRAECLAHADVQRCVEQRGAGAGGAGDHPVELQGGREAQRGLGGAVDGLEAGMDCPADRGLWPAPQGQPQHEWEAPRIVEASQQGRTHRLKALGNGWVPQQAVAAWMELTDGLFDP